MTKRKRKGPRSTALHKSGSINPCKYYARTMSEIKKAVVRATHKRQLSKPESETLSGRHILHAETFGEWVEETSRCRLVGALDVDRVMSIHYH